MKHALVTGTSSGIGLATSLHFARHGYHVYATMRAPAKAAELLAARDREKLPIDVLPLDVTELASVRDCLESIHAGCDALDVLVNNSGLGAAGPLEELSEEEHRAIFEVNYFGAIRLVQGVLPRMRARRQGAIINVSSVIGRVPLVGQAAYAASKHALEAATEVLAQELVAHGVRVALVEPGVFQTKIWENSEATTHYDKASPYRAAMRRNGRFYGRLRKTAGDPNEVAETIFRAANEGTAKLRHPVGWDAKQLISGRYKISDEEWVDLCNDLSDAEYGERFQRYFGIDI